MRTRELAAVLWWAQSYGPNAFDQPNTGLDDVVQNFMEWTTRDERAVWVSVAGRLKAEAKETRELATTRKHKRPSHAG